MFLRRVLYYALETGFNVNFVLLRAAYVRSIFKFQKELKWKVK